MTNTLKLDTNVIHEGQQIDNTTFSRAPPLYLTTSYAFKDNVHAANLFALKEFGNIYTRLMNPTTDIFEKRIASIEGGSGALAVSSGQAAETLSLLNFTRVNDEILSLDNLYGGTYQLFNHTFPKLGRKVNFVSSNASFDDIKKRITPKTKAIYAESIGNPKLNIPDFQVLSEIAHVNNIPLVIDNTCGVYLTQPIKFGADIIVSSATKFIGGHGTSIGGVIIDSGRFDWSKGNFPELTENDPSYHGLNYWNTFGNHPDFGNIAFIIKARVHLLRDLGSCISPFNSFQFLQGLETLHLRVPRHSENALKVAKFLEKHPKVSWVNYPGLETHPSHDLAKKYFSKGFGALVGFGIKGGKEAGIKFINSVKLISHLANIGDAKTLVIHPASTTHQQLTCEEQQKTGVTDDYIRLSIGVEDPEDIIEDIDQALSKVNFK